MAPRRLERLLTTAAFGLLVAQGGLFATLWTRPEAPDDLPALETAIQNHRARTPTDAPAPAEGDRAAVELLDRLLAERLAQAAASQGRSAAGLGPTVAQRQAAFASPAPKGPAVLALVDAYAAALGKLGETLDATSSRASAGSP